MRTGRFSFAVRLPAATASGKIGNIRSCTSSALCFCAALLRNEGPSKAGKALLPDAEAAEDFAEDLFRVGMADDLADSGERGAHFLGDELG
jgi:hypothetical protein